MDVCVVGVQNFAVAVDDHLMKISHVIRAEEHLPNTLRQVCASKPYELSGIYVSLPLLAMHYRPGISPMCTH